jgi:hypothetical protein
VIAALRPVLFVFLRVTAYVLGFAIFSSLGFLSSAILFRRMRLARWLCLINLPGAALVLYFVVNWMMGA